MICLMADEFILSIGRGVMETAKYYEMEGIHKVFVAKDRTHTYYVQEMPGYWDYGRNYAVMKDRKRLYGGRFDSYKQAVGWLLAYLSRELDRPELDL